VAPMISGAGLQNKILQAMAFKKCVITTNIGAEGLKGVTSKEIVIEDNTIKMAERISFLLKNKKKRDEIGLSAEKYVKENFSKEKIESEFLKYLWS
jgi:glycosyltransferase involved in cell wall biosynthesis